VVQQRAIASIELIKSTNLTLTIEILALLGAFIGTVAFSGIENELFFADNTRLCYGDGQKVVAELIAGVKAL